MLAIPSTYSGPPSLPIPTLSTSVMRIVFLNRVPLSKDSIPLVTGVDTVLIGVSPITMAPSHEVPPVEVSLPQ